MACYKDSFIFLSEQLLDSQEGLVWMDLII
jgi:hypothetical protein